MIKINQKGFTLIELLVVIAIIGILSSVVLTSLGSARNKAKRASALATVSGIGTEFILCADDAGNIQAPSDTGSGAGAICSVAGHTTLWPTLANANANFCYDWNSGVAGCDNLAASVSASIAGAQTFDIIDKTDNSVIFTCTWSGVENLTCS